MADETKADVLLMAVAELTKEQRNRLFKSLRTPAQACDTVPPMPEDVLREKIHRLSAEQKKEFLSALELLEMFDSLSEEDKAIVLKHIEEDTKVRENATMVRRGKVN